MRSSLLLTAIAAFSQVLAAPKAATTCSLVPTTAGLHFPQNCGIYAQLDDDSKQVMSTSTQPDMMTCANLCHESGGKSFGYDAASSNCEIYSKYLQHMNMSPVNASAGMVYYHMQCFKTKCSRVAPTSTSSACVCTETFTSTLTSYTKTQTMTMISVMPTTLSAIWSNTTTTSYITNGYTITNTSMLPTTTMTTTFTSTTTSTTLNTTTTQTIPETTTSTTTLAATSTTYVPLTAAANFARKSCQCASPVSTSTVVAYRTINAVATTSTTITQAPTYTPSPNISTVLDVLTTSVLSEVDIYLISTTIIQTTIESLTSTATFTSTEVDLTTTTQTIPATTTSTSISSLPTVTCPASNGAVYTDASGNTYDVSCGYDYPGDDIFWATPSSPVVTSDFDMTQQMTVTDFQSCIQACGIVYGCVGIIWEEQNSYCFFKNGMTTKTKQSYVCDAAFLQTMPVPDTMGECGYGPGMPECTDYSNFY